MIRYKTLTHAKTQLSAQGWTEVKPGVWVSDDRTCIATVNFTPRAAVYITIKAIGA